MIIISASGKARPPMRPASRRLVGQSGGGSVWSVLLTSHCTAALFDGMPGSSSFTPCLSIPLLQPHPDFFSRPSTFVVESCHLRLPWCQDIMKVESILVSVSLHLVYLSSFSSAVATGTLGDAQQYSSKWQVRPFQTPIPWFMTC